MFVLSFFLFRPIFLKQAKNGSKQWNSFPIILLLGKNYVFVSYHFFLILWMNLVVHSNFIKESDYLRKFSFGPKLAHNTAHKIG